MVAVTGGEISGEFRGASGMSGPGWSWGAELELVAFLGSTGKWICALVGISSSLISDLGAELSCHL